ncbi:hypothetical protein IFM89_031882 [Coptis chinensis]|uniref:Uncharacterized protein n=1 Tax=Coptis chinensis TaxID=261450 RepID=A0A835M7E4_9MAGN|nr:hypothetical protein IFM89_031882 [Coptis chinensis]
MLLYIRMTMALVPLKSIARKWKKDGSALIQDLWKTDLKLSSYFKNRKKILYDGGTASFSFFVRSELESRSNQSQSGWILSWKSRELGFSVFRKSDGDVVGVYIGGIGVDTCYVAESQAIAHSIAKAIEMSRPANVDGSSASK